jgi:hypothetical protein
MAYTQSLNRETKLNQVSFSLSRCGIAIVSSQASPDGFFPETAKMLRPTVAGNIVAEGIDGNILYCPNASGWVPFLCKRILTSATIDGEAVTTTATGIYWFGGA